MTKAAVLIPAYNPCSDLARLVQELISLGVQAVVIADCSGAGNQPVLDALSSLKQCHVLRSDESAGRALKTGLTYIKDNFPDFSGVVTVRTDQNANTQDILKVAQAIEADRTEILLGCFGKERGRPAAETFAVRVIRISFGLLAGIKVADPRTGLRGFPMSVLPWMIEHQPEKDGSEPNVLLVARRHGIRISQITLETTERQQAPRIPFAGFVRIYALLIMFSLSSLVSYLFDIGIYALLIGTVFAQSQNAILYCTVIARVFSSVLNFAINKRIVFKDLRSDHTIFVRYVTLTLLRMFASFAGVYALTTSTGIDSRIVKVGVDLVLFFVGFRLQQGWVFSKQTTA
ncbi:MAG: GtrA family protein [Bacillota bacterium]